MLTIHDMLADFRKRAGIRAAVVLGRDGLLISSDSEPGLDAEAIAAHVPTVVVAAADIGRAGDLGALQSAVLEHDGGIAIVSVLSPDTQLVLLLAPDASFGDVLFELRRDRPRLASLV